MADEPSRDASAPERRHAELLALLEHVASRVDEFEGRLEELALLQDPFGPIPDPGSGPAPGRPQQAKVDWRKLRGNASTWKNNEELCSANSTACGNAARWVRDNGKFPKRGQPSGNDFDGAMSLGGNNGDTLASAFTLAKLFGVLAQETSFNTVGDTAGPIRGPFQLSEAAVEEFNRANEPDVTWPDDVDDQGDIATAARVGAWYLASLLQRFTYAANGPITDPHEANKFALAAYNAGIGRIRRARRAASQAGGNPNRWADVAPHAPEETRQYVANVCAYEQIAYELGCVL